MTKRIIITIVGLIAVIGVLGGIKGLQIERMIAQGKQFSPPPEPVNTAVVRKETWESLISAVGSLEAVQGVIVTAELPGKVERIEFEAGTKVKAGDLLLQQDISTETAQLRSAEAALTLTEIEIDRKRKLLAQKTISRSEYDNAEAQFKQAAAQADTIRATIKKKTIRAPFAGRLGIRLVNVGQVLKEGEPIVSLQSIDPIFVNFSLPQQQLVQVEPGLSVRVTTDALPGQALEGIITAINPQVDAATRNIRMQATMTNPEERLRPGMFVTVTVVLPVRQDLLAIPATSVLYAPYSDSVFVVEEQKDANNGRLGKTVRQQFVRLGERQGDYVAVLAGLEEGQTVVSTGVFKLRNGQSVVVDNTLTPEFKLNPEPEES
ncbi:MAG: efflux RND transporter periplasmic adaptor subunit [Deltaproteobacteria bacterium]|nr:efflux RND transporter periplasmic adaptor subunit [Deltaproteobacteria bacterium]